MSEIENGKLGLHVTEHSKCNHLIILGFKGLTREQRELELTKSYKPSPLSCQRLADSEDIDENDQAIAVAPAAAAAASRAASTSVNNSCEVCLLVSTAGVALVQL